MKNNLLDYTYNFVFYNILKYLYYSIYIVYIHIMIAQLLPKTKKNNGHNT